MVPAADDGYAIDMYSLPLRFSIVPAGPKLTDIALPIISPWLVHVRQSIEDAVLNALVLSSQKTITLFLLTTIE